jgi:hypothetical protein
LRFKTFHKTSSLFDLFHQGESASLNFIRQFFNRIGSSERISGPANARLVGDDLLSSNGENVRFFRGKGIRFIIRSGMDRLAPSKDGSERLNSRPHDIIQRLLGRQGQRGGLTDRVLKWGSFSPFKYRSYSILFEELINLSFDIG